MNIKDFNFFRRKEFLVLLFLLLLIAFSQIALDKQNLPSLRMLNITPLIVIDSVLIENLGLILPVFTAIFLYFNYRRKSESTWVPPASWISISLIIFLVLLSLPPPQNLEEVNPVSSNTTTVIPQTNVQSEIVTPPPVLHTYTAPKWMENISPLIQFLLDFRTLIILFILFLPLVVILILQKRSEKAILDNITDDKNIQDEQLYQHTTRTILECYYQSSDSLEDRGADDSPNLTPTEFKIDVNDKKLTTNESIDGITNLFEEAKFSNHEINEEQVDAAKDYSHEILLAGWKRHKIEDEEP